MPLPAVVRKRHGAVPPTLRLPQSRPIPALPSWLLPLVVVFGDPAEPGELQRHARVAPHEAEGARLGGHDRRTPLALVRAGAGGLGLLLQARGRVVGALLGLVLGEPGVQRRELGVDLGLLGAQRVDPLGVDGFRAGLAESDLAVHEDAIVPAAFTRDGGYEALRTLLSRFPDTDTIFATSDLMATGVLTALRDLGKEPGRDVSVAGFDDIALVRDVTPPLTTVVAPLSDMGYRAVRLALAERGKDGPVVLPVNTAVVIRESTPQRG